MPEELDDKIISNENSIRDNTEISLSLLDSIRLKPGDYLIGKFRESLHVNNDMLLFVEEINQQVWVFDHSGLLKFIIGGFGRGPEEFMLISGVFIDEHGRIIVTDQRLNMVKVFDSRGELINTFSLFDSNEMYISSRDIFVYDNLLYIQIIEAEYLSEPQKSRLIARYTLEGEFVDYIGWFDPSIVDSYHYIKAHNFTVDKNEEILISSLRTSYHLQLFGIQDTTIYEYFGRRPSFWESPDEEINPFLPREKIMEMTIDDSYSVGLFITNKFYLMHSQKTSELWYGTSDYIDKPNYITIYDRVSRSYLGSKKIPGVFKAMHNDILYLIEDFDPDNFVISKYEIEIN